MHILSFYTYKKTPPKERLSIFCHFCFFNSDLAILIHPFSKFPFFVFSSITSLINLTRSSFPFCSCNSRKFLCIRKSHISQYKIRIKIRYCRATIPSKTMPFSLPCFTQAPRRERLSAPQILPHLLSGRRLLG